MRLPQDELLDEAINEAKRFLSRAQKVKQDLKDSDNPRLLWMFGSPNTASMKRSSLDLTRALAALRNGGRR